MNPLDALVVEDDPTTQRLLQSILHSRGYRVTACADAETAWSLCPTTPYALLVLDWLLPGMDGLQLCRKVRALPHGQQSVIVVLTGRDQPDDLHCVLDAGADDYLTKPVDVARLEVRLTIAEQQVRHRSERHAAQAGAATMLLRLQQSRDDLLSILNQLRIGSVLTDAQGRTTFLSRVCQQLLGREAGAMIGRPWEEHCPFDATARAQLRAMASLPPGSRSKVAARVDAAAGRHYWVDVEVHDDPRDPQRKIYFLYDMTEVHDLRRLLADQAQLEDLVGKSEPMLQVFEQIREVAAVDSTVLIEGETGTGKELVARAIHALSPRNGPFVAMNCAGLTESLLGSQLFGHKRGAFTGAIDEHKGLFEAADGGTLFLDEIGDVPLSVQSSLLRVLQEREIVRLGESTPRKIDVRVIAATHHHLADDVAKGSFRSDLLYRIRVARVQLPPLRSRVEDIPLLVGVFLNQFAVSTGKGQVEMSSDAMGRLLRCPWPGNVRELRGAIEYAVIRCKSGVIETHDLPPEIVDMVATTIMPALTPDGEAQRILAALTQVKGNRVAAARVLGMSRATLYRRLSDLNLPLK